MEWVIVEREGFTVVGLRYFGSLEGADFGELWQELAPGAVPDVVQGAAYGLMSTPNERGEFEYVAGYEVAGTDNVPEGMVARQVSASTYLAVACTIPTIGLTYAFFFERWLPTSGYQRGEGYDFEYYGESFDPLQPNTSLMYVYFPIQKA